MRRIIIDNAIALSIVFYIAVGVSSYKALTFCYISFRRHEFIYTGLGAKKNIKRRNVYAVVHFLVRG